MLLSSKDAWSIRPVTPADRPALSYVNLITGDAGRSAKGLHHIPELSGLIYGEPYTVISPSFGFVLVDERDEVLGCILGTPDTRRFEAAIEKDWFAPLRAQARYSKDPYPANATPADRRMINLIHKPDIAPEEIIQVAKAHIHIDLLPRAQKQGWGRRLMSKAVEYLREQGCDSLHVDIDPRNVNGRAFYKAVGFEFVPTATGECYRLDFAHWK
ncbi:hypothetical protein FRC07_011865 [Ceratobasidium sp. 392]|nr:hypothetical protein FRC07_011865 [Ceratobasidium sp. 392]